MKIFKKISCEKGVTLAVGLIVLLFITIIAIAGMRLGIFDEKISYNSSDSQRSFLSAEAAMLDAENFILGLTNTSAFNNTNGLYTLGNGPNPLSSTTWTGTASVAGGSVTGTQTPLYYIEYLGNYAGAGSQTTSVDINNYGQETGAIENVNAFRIVSHGSGTTSKAQTIVESFYFRSF